MASKRSPACGVRKSDTSGRRVGGGRDAYGSGGGAVGSRPDVVVSGRRYGLLRRPSNVPELVGRPGVGDGRTDGSCCRGGVVGGVDGVVVCSAWRRRARWSWMRKLRCSSSNCSNRSSKSRSSAANTPLFWLSGGVVVLGGTEKDMSLLLSSPYIGVKNHGVISFFSGLIYVITNAMWQSTTRAFVWMKNNNVLIKEIIAGLYQPEWGQTHLCCCYRLPSVRCGTLGCLCWVRPRTLQQRDVKD